MSVGKFIFRLRHQEKKKKAFIFKRHKRRRTAGEDKHTQARMTFKDRTAEFRESIQKLNTTIRMPQKPVSTTSPKQKFTVASAALAFSLKAMEEKLERLAKREHSSSFHPHIFVTRVEN